MNDNGDGPTADKLRQEIDAQRAIMVSVATGGPPIDSVNDQYTERRTRISRSLSMFGLEDPNPFEDLWAWRAKWSSGDLPTYQSRRDYLRELYAPLLASVGSGAGMGNVLMRPPTGWERVDRAVNKAHQSLAVARDEEECQSVGHLCREVLISLAQAVYDPRMHRSPDGVQPSETDAKRMLHAYLAAELAGGSNDEMRKYAKAAVDLANKLQHARTAGFRDAAMCVEATTSVVNFIAIASGRRDPGGQA